MKSNHPVPELLCPAGSEEALHAAVDSGADAVYLGTKAFGARASAVNFDGEGLARAVEYAHLHHVRVHVTVNTLVKEQEFSGVRETLRAIASARADAVIVQDLGVAALVLDEFPALKLHASTQMALSNASDAFARTRLRGAGSGMPAGRNSPCGGDGRGDGSLCPRRAVYRRQRPVLDVLHGGRTKRQPGPVRSGSAGCALNGTAGRRRGFR